MVCAMGEDGPAQIRRRVERKRGMRRDKRCREVGYREGNERYVQSAR